MAMELHERLSGSAAGDVAPVRPDPFAELKNRIHLSLIEDLGRQIFTRDLDQAGMAANVTAEIRSRLDQEPGISREDRERLVSELADDILGHGPLERLLADDTISEIMVNGPHDVWIEREGLLHRTTARFTDESHLRRIINKMVAEVGRRIDEAQPTRAFPTAAASTP
jgi:pilus assembly protein CpaF